MNEGESKFWIVWGRGKPMGTKQHATFDDALNEANRLARQERNAFYVLEVKTVSAPIEPSIGIQHF